MDPDIYTTSITLDIGIGQPERLAKTQAKAEPENKQAGILPSPAVSECRLSSYHGQCPSVLRGGDKVCISKAWLRNTTGGSHYGGPVKILQKIRLPQKRMHFAQ